MNTKQKIIKKQIGTVERADSTQSVRFYYRVRSVWLRPRQCPPSATIFNAVKEFARKSFLL